MIELYTWTTPNGVKPLIMLEETGLSYHVTPVDIGNGAQHELAYLAINPNGKIPALVDDGVRIFESAAILIHLAEKTGKFLPKEGQARADVLSWLMVQIGGIGPMFGQLGHFIGAKREDPYPVERYRKEVERLASVLETRLAKVPYLGGAEYSIADMATIGWVRALGRLLGNADGYPHITKWVDIVSERPPVAKALAWKRM